MKIKPVAIQHANLWKKVAKKERFFPAQWVVGVMPPTAFGVLRFLTVLTLLLGAWEIAAYLEIPMYKFESGRVILVQDLFSQPSEIAKLIFAWEEIGPRYSILAHLKASAWRVFPGLFVGTIIGFPLGVLAALYPRYFVTVLCIVALLYATSKLAVYYAFTMWVSDYETPKFMIAVWSAFFMQFVLVFWRSVTLLYMEHRIDIKTRVLVEKAIDVGANKLQLFRRVLVPLALPQLQVAFLISSASVWTMLVVTEPVGSTIGLGFLVTIGNEGYHLALFFAATFMLAFANLCTWIVARACFRLIIK